MQQPSFSTDLAEFLTDLRTVVFSSTPKAAEYFALKSHTTVVRYEQGRIKPSAGYLLELARLVADRQVRAGQEFDKSQAQILRQVNIVLLEYYPDDGPYETWGDLCRAADAYIGKQRLEALPLNASIPAPAPLPYGSRTRELSVNPLFVGRDDALRELARALKLGHERAVVQIAAATGMGGVGKTQLAIEFMHRYGQFFAGGVFWLSFADGSAVASEVAACGGPGYMDLRAGFAKLSLDEQVQLVRAAWQQPLPRLLVFDNCEDEHLLARWRPSAGGCRVIVTSRREGWNKALGVQVLSLDVLTRQSSIALLRSYCHHCNVDDGVLDAIATQLGDLPLALHLAGSFLDTYRHDPLGNPEAYLTQLQSEALDHASLQAEGAPFSPTWHEQHVARTFALSYERLDPINPIDALARVILSRIACFAPGEAVPRVLLDETCAPHEADYVDAAIQRLGTLALVRVEQNGAIWMHRLIADFMRAYALDPAAQPFVEAAMVRVMTRYQTIDDTSTLISLQPHMRWVTDAALPRRDHQAVELCYWLCYHLWQIAAYANAQLYLEQTRAWLLTADDDVGRMDLANITELLGLNLQLQNDFVSAQAMFEQGLMIRTKTVGPDDIETATSHNNLGSVLTQLGELDNAWFHLKRSLQIRLKAFGKNNDDAARTLTNLGYILKHRGRFAATERLFRLALDIRQRVLPPVTFATAQSLNNVGDVCMTQGHYSEAWEYHQQALAMRLQLFEEHHHDTAESYRRLGEILAVQHQFVDALAMLERAYAINMDLIGPNNIETILIIVSLGAVLCDLGRYDEARTHLEQSVMQISVQFGSHHFWMLDARQELCRLDIVTGRWKEAQQGAEQLVAIPQHTQGKAHPRIATAYHLLGQALEGQGDVKGALAHYEHALSLAQLLLGHAHPQIGILQASIASAQQRLRPAD